MAEITAEDILKWIRTSVKIQLTVSCPRTNSQGESLKDEESTKNHRFGMIAAGMQKNALYVSELQVLTARKDKFPPLTQAGMAIQPGN
jgi:hypothetical protein